MPERPVRAIFMTAALLVVAIWLLAVSRWIVTDSVVPWDSKNQFYAFFRFLAASLESGTSPFWNPYHYGGHPSVADPQSLIFAPLMALYAWLDPAPSLVAFDIVVFGHLLIGGIAIAALGASARWPVAACVLAAAVFMFGGMAAGRLQHTGIILSYGLFPLALLLLLAAMRRRSLLLGLAFALVASAIALGRNQVAMLLCYLLIAIAAAEVIAADRPWTYLRQRLALLAIMAVAGLMLVGPPLLLTMQFAALSNRSAIAIDHALLGSLHPANLAQLAVAGIFGSHRYDYWGPDAATEPQVALTDDSFNYLYVGSVPIILLLWLGVAGGLAYRTGRRLYFAVAVVALLYMLGRYTPMFAFAFDWVPGVSRFRRPVDAGFVFNAVLALLCGALLADYIRNGPPSIRILRLAAIVVLAATAVTAGVMFSSRTGHSGEALRAVLVSSLVAAVVIAILALARGPRLRAVSAIAVTALAVAELIGWNAAFRLNAQPRARYAVLERPDGPAAQALQLVEQAIDARRRRGERPRVEVLGLGGPWQNAAMVRSLEAVNGYNPLRIGTYDRVVAPGEINWNLESRQFPPSFDSYDGPMARTLGLEFVILGGPIESVPHLARRPVADVLRAGPDIWVYRLRNPSPRLVFTRRVQVADADAAAFSPDTSPAPDRVLIDDDTPPVAGYSGAAAAGHARMVEWRASRIEIEVDSVLGGVLALHETRYPGWVAEIDGGRVPILRADVLFRGVEIPPGVHRVVFRFAPFAWDNLRDALLRGWRRRS